ncbi:MAG: metallophosphoesterase [Ruminococcaceae bacterium]|nr:metallophosphoesterase [Oscillospiraceae bacterium]
MIIAVFSDTHGDNTSMLSVVDSNKDIKAVIHCGDVADDIDSLKMCFPNLSIYGVRGNNDYFTNYPRELICEIDGLKFFITHGHFYSVKMGETIIKSACRDFGCDICVYGHTHKSSFSEENGIFVLNPGSSKYSGTYALIDTETKKIIFKKI